jgi:CHAT domain-containing protein
VIPAFKNNQLIHFSTHGFFPLQDNPFDHSGLLLSDNNKLPTLHKHDPNYKYKDDGLHLLSPERLLARECDLAQSHISLQACVAGYAREGIGGDALGIEWAFLQKGACSLISTFWNVDIHNANEFYSYFYDEWLNRKTSKARAHQKAILKLKQTSYESHLPDEFFWAGYGLIGDWR